MHCQKDKFNVESHVHYINGAYMSPQLRAVTEAGVQAAALKSRPYSTSPPDFFTVKEQVRGLFAQLVNAPTPQHIALVPSASYGMGIVARNLKASAGQTIVITEAQFPSNVYPWMRLAKEKGLEIITVPMPLGSAQRGQIWNERILEAIDHRTALVSIGHIHWANGTLFDLAAIGQKVHQSGGILAIDGTQSVGALPIDVQAMGIDALVCAGYKWLLGPYGYGYAYFSPSFWDGIPLEENWINRENSEDFAGLTQYREGYQPGALRFDAGESSNFILAPMCAVALQQLLDWQPARIQAYCQTLLQPYLESWQAKGYEMAPPSQRAAHLFGIQLPPQASEQTLQTALKANNILLSVRGGFIRVSPNVYNDSADIEALNAVLTEIIK